MENNKDSTFNNSVANRDTAEAIERGKLLEKDEITSSY
jgi:hypothetical protein